MEMTGSESNSSSEGLEFGKEIYFGDVGIGVPANSGGGSTPVARFKGPLQAPAKTMGKKERGRGCRRCQVEGCDLDLSGAKGYYARHKVCGMHSKCPVVVVVAGLEQRFCQQCSRFHRLPEFDQGKRSCHSRLE